MGKGIKKSLSRLGIFKAASFAGVFFQRILPFAILVILLGGSLVWVGRSLYAARILELEKIRITGLETLTAQDIIRLTGLKKGMNLLQLNLDEYVHAIQKDPRIRTAAFRKLFPNRLEIRIEERRPLLQIYAPQKKSYFLVDEEGVLLPGSSPGPEKEFMVFEDVTVKSFSETVGVHYPSRHLETLIKNFEALENDPLLEEEKIRTIRVDELGFWTFVSEDGIEFRVGDSFENLNKLENFKILLHSEVRQTLAYLDLRFQDVVVKIKQESKAKKTVAQKKHK